MAEERRIDTDDDIAYTWEEMFAFYKKKHKKKEIEAYWEECKPIRKKKGKKAKEEDAPEPKAKAKAKSKSKAQEGEKADGKKAKADGSFRVKDKVTVKKTNKGSKSGQNGLITETNGHAFKVLGKWFLAEELQRSKGGKLSPMADRRGAPMPPKEAKGQGKAKAEATSKAKREPKPAGGFKVCVCGGAGGIGQPLSLLMAMDPNVGDLRIFDLNVAMVAPEGVAADLGHLERKCSVKGHVMPVGEKPIDHLEECLTGCHLVLVPAGVPRKPGMTRDDLFGVNAGIASGIVEACAKFCPDAVLGMIVNPVNSVVPAMAEMYKKKGLDPMKIVGITTLDVVRANKFVGQITGKNPNYVNVPVIGGHAGATIMPVFSQDKTAATIDAEKIPELDKHVQNAGTEVVEAKGGKGSATLSMAYAGARFGKSVLAGLSGRKRVECAYCKSEVTDLPYFTQKVVLGQGGIVKVLPLGDLNEYETKRLEEAKVQLKMEIETGLKYAETHDFA